jgi:hypothetical protein
VHNLLLFQVTIFHFNKQPYSMKLNCGAERGRYYSEIGDFS